MITFLGSLSELIEIMRSFYEAIGVLESNHSRITTAFACFLRIAAKARKIENAELRRFAQGCIGERAKLFSIPIMALATFLDPRYRFKFRVQRQPELFKLIGKIGRGCRYSLKSLHAPSQQFEEYTKGHAPFDLDVEEAKLLADPWHWWCGKKNTAPELATIALKLLSISPTTASCERTFSLMGWIYSKRRNKLTSERLSDMTKIIDFYDSSDQNKYKGKSDVAHKSLEECLEDEELDLTELLESVESERHMGEAQSMMYDEEILNEDNGVDNLLEKIIDIDAFSNDELGQAGNDVEPEIVEEEVGDEQFKTVLPFDDSP